MYFTLIICPIIVTNAHSCRAGVVLVILATYIYLPSIVSVYNFAEVTVWAATLGCVILFTACSSYTVYNILYKSVDFIDMHA